MPRSVVEKIKQNKPLTTKTKGNSFFRGKVGEPGKGFCDYARGSRALGRTPQRQRLSLMSRVLELERNLFCLGRGGGGMGAGGGGD